MIPQLVTTSFLLMGITLRVHGQAPQLHPGARLRLTFPCELQAQGAAGDARTECSAEGKLVQVRSDTITIAVGGSAMSYRPNAVDHIEVSRGQRSHVLVGAGAGFLVGAGVTFVLLHGGGSTSLCDQSANQDAIGSGECIGLAALGGIGGAGLGALIGAFVRTERWQDVPIEGLRVIFAP